MEPAADGDPWRDVNHLRDLIISDCDLSSESVFNVLCYLPSLRSIFAVGNRFSYFRVPDLSDSLTSLDIGSNRIRCLSSISGNLKRLEKLSVAGCGIEKLEIIDGQFPNLSILNIKDNVISDWDSINQLQRLSKLSVLYIDCEHLRCAPGIDVHEVVIAKLAGLIDLNRFEISSVERQSAEVRFLDKYFAADDAVKAVHSEDIERLKKIHGTGAVDTKSYGLDVLALSISYEGATVKRRLPLAITVQKLMEMVGRVFSIGSLSVRLELDKGGYKIQLDNPIRTLDFYSPEPGDIIRLVAT